MWTDTIRTTPPSRSQHASRNQSRRSPSAATMVTPRGSVFDAVAGLIARRGEREAGPRHRDREGQDEARAVAIGDSPHDEGVEAAQHQGRRERDRDGAPAPAEVLGQHRQEDAERGDGARGAEHDGEERAGDQPALAHERRGAHRALTIHAVWYAMRASTWPRPRSGSASPSSASRTRVSSLDAAPSSMTIRRWPTRATRPSAARRPPTRASSATTSP